MSKQEKIIIALHQIDSIESLCSDLDYSDYLTSKCIKLRYELQRQLSLIKSHQDDLVFDR
jgi:uncharacterized protein YukJ